MTWTHLSLSTLAGVVGWVVIAAIAFGLWKLFSALYGVFFPGG